ncbi:hypothetical protein BH09PLA1_BH09PLA1_23410 [soil metagenome]
MRRFTKSTPSGNEFWEGQHRREHWYVDNSIYFITARCVDKYPAFRSDEAKRIFWDRAGHWSKEHGFVPIVRSLLDNHYHWIGYKKVGADLGEMMRKIHGSVAKLVNDVLLERRVPFWKTGHDTYFDGCLRDEIQFRRTFRYVLLQAVRHRIVSDWRDYPHTRVNVELEVALKRALQLNAFMQEVPYQRYEKCRRVRGRV